MDTSRENADRVAEELYAAALHPERLRRFLDAWDRRILAPILSRDDLSLKQKVEAENLLGHFKSALEIAELKRDAADRSLGERLRRDTQPCLALAPDASICLLNDAARVELGIAEGHTLADLVPDATGERRLRSGLKALSSSMAQTTPQPFVVSLFGLHGQHAPFIAYVERRADTDQCVLVLRCCKASWDEFGSAMLAEAFALTPAEIRVLKALCEGLSPADIAKQRGRSIETIRRQVKAVMAKTETRSQSEVVRLSTDILHLCAKMAVAAPTQLVSDTELDHTRFERIAMADGRVLEWFRYGDPDGKPILLFQPNSLPILPSVTLALMRDAGLHVVAPFKPGTMGSSADAFFSPERHVADALAAMRQLGLQRFWMAGHNMGGIYALIAAGAAPDCTEGVIMLDTGAPIVEMRAIRAMPPTARRSFLAAREAPETLYSAYAIVANLFFSGTAGRHTVREMAYADSPLDIGAMMDEEIARCVERNLEYSLCDPTRAVDDLVLWVRDWTHLLDVLPASISVTMIHGERHDWLPFEDVARLAAGRSQVEAIGIAKTGQLGLYTRAAEIVKTLARVTSG